MRTYIAGAEIKHRAALTENVYFNLWELYSGFALGLGWVGVKHHLKLSIHSKCGKI